MSSSTARSVVVYDGDCGICDASARFIRRNVSSVDVMSHHEYGVQSLASVWFVTDRARHEGADAVATILRSADKRWLRVSGAVLALPVIRLIAKVVYFVIARNRRRISQLLGMKACAVPASK